MFEFLRYLALETKQIKSNLSDHKLMIYYNFSLKLKEVIRTDT